MPVILGKTDEHPEWLAVWEKYTVKQVENYLISNRQPKKLICTPEGFRKFRRAAQQKGIDIYKVFLISQFEVDSMSATINVAINHWLKISRK
ncbi:hypothetical protein JQM84_03850 [Parabacteroides distasonis]|nr:hypothetical protein [Parabacteroides distasonis]MDD5783968.1 hypothetical protein [Prevotella sp.]